MGLEMLPAPLRLAHSSTFPDVVYFSLISLTGGYHPFGFIELLVIVIEPRPGFGDLLIVNVLAIVVVVAMCTTDIDYHLHDF